MVVSHSLLANFTSQEFENTTGPRMGRKSRGNTARTLNFRQGNIRDPCSGRISSLESSAVLKTTDLVISEMLEIAITEFADEPVRNFAAAMTMEFIISEMENELEGRHNSPDDIAVEMGEDAGYQKFDVSYENYRDDDSIISQEDSSSDDDDDDEDDRAGTYGENELGDDDETDDVSFGDNAIEKSFFLKWDAKLNKIANKAEKRWKMAGENGARDRSSRATFYRDQNMQRETAKIASQSMKITQFISATQGSNSTTADEYDSDVEIALSAEMRSPPEISAASLKALSYAEAIELIHTEYNFASRNKIADRKLKCLGTWQRMQALACLRYFEILNSKRNVTKTDASVQVASILYGRTIKNSYKAQQIRSWSNHFLQYRTFPTYSQGQHVKTATVIHDERVQVHLKAWLRSIPDIERNPQRFAKDLNDQLLREIPNAPQSVTEPTSKKWMIFLGFYPTKASKGWFTDGHERDDVVRYRNDVFLPKMESIESQLRKYTKESDYSECILPDGIENVIITHDESTTYANEGRAVFYMEGGKKKCLPKGKGLSLMISGFACQCHGFMEFNGQKSYELFEFGKNRDGAWKNEDLIQQARRCKPIFDGLHPNCNIYLGFDNSMNHHKKAPDGLDASVLLLSDGGKNTPIIRNGWYLNENGERLEQRMQHDDGKPKGLETILRERGKFHNGRGYRLLKICQCCASKIPHSERTWIEDEVSKYLCCATFVLSQEPDFLEQREWLTKLLKMSLDLTYFFIRNFIVSLILSSSCGVG